MKNWLENNWSWLIIVLTILYLISIFTGWTGYRKKQKESSKAIKEYQHKIEFSDQIIKSLVVEIGGLEARVAEKDREIEKKERRIGEIAKDRDAWKERVKTMPPSAIVVETRRELETDEVWEREDGVLFSLVAARKNLSFLGEFSLVKRELQELRGAFSLSQAQVNELKEANLKLKRIDLERSGQLSNAYGMATEWKYKFGLAHNQIKISRQRGQKEGAIVGGAIGFFLGILIDR